LWLISKFSLAPITPLPPPISLVLSFNRPFVYATTACPPPSFFFFFAHLTRYLIPTPYLPVFLPQPFRWKLSHFQMLFSVAVLGNSHLTISNYRRRPCPFRPIYSIFQYCDLTPTPNRTTPLIYLHVLSARRIGLVFVYPYYPIVRHSLCPRRSLTSSKFVTKLLSRPLYIPQLLIFALPPPSSKFQYTSF